MKQEPTAVPRLGAAADVSHTSDLYDDRLPCTDTLSERSHALGIRMARFSLGHTSLATSLITVRESLTDNGFQKSA
jgi:hypothetical protein